MNYTSTEIANILNAEIKGAQNDSSLEHICFDTRKIFKAKHTVFFALKGEKNDGHFYIKNAYQQNIRVFVVEKEIEELKEATFILVEDTLKALQKLAEHYRNQFNLDVLAITGSNGKTIVKEWLNQLIYDKFNIVRSTKSYNSQIGVPVSLIQIEKEHNLGLFEAGISTVNEMEFLEKMIQPKIGIFTNIGNAHSQGFPDKKTHIKEKLKLFKNSETIIYNNSDELLNSLIQEECNHLKTISFGSQNDSNVKLIQKTDLENGSILEVEINGQIVNLEIPFQDSASIENCLCLLAILLVLDINILELIPKFKTLQSVEMRLEMKAALHDSIIINDSFNSDLQSIKIALEVLAEQSKSKKVLVLSDIQDSNIPKKELYKNVASMVNEFKINECLLVGKEIALYKDFFKGNVLTFSSTKKTDEYLTNKEYRNTAILLKGARKFHLENIAKRLEIQSHDTVLEVNLNALISNLNYFKNLLKSDTKIMAMVKAFSYGTGDYEIAQTLENQGIDYLGVAYADEGVKLRKSGIKTPIMVMNPEQNSYSTIIRYNLEPEIYSFRVLKLFVNELVKSSVSKVYPIHIKLNTGMNRLGFKQNHISELLEILSKMPQVKVASIFSHLASADVKSEDDFTLEQINSFNNSYQTIVAKLTYKPIKHILLSHGVIKFPEYQYDMVRLGLGMYGYSSDAETQKNLINTIRFRTVISQIIELKKGESVSYNRNFIANEPTKIATLPVGYADGVNRLLSNGVGYVIIHNKKAEIVGNICMDMMMVNVTKIDCEEGNEVTILGDEPNVKEVAKRLNTIPYEVLTSISPRVKRVYYKE